jgi:hypothetical protein
MRTVRTGLGGEIPSIFFAAREAGSVQGCGRRPQRRFHTRKAGVGNWPRDEIAEGGAPRVRLALWGFELARRDDSGGSAP